MLDATRTTTRQRILDMYASNNNNIFAAGAAADLDRATTARPGVYDGVGTWFAQSYQPAWRPYCREDADRRRPQRKRKTPARPHPWKREGEGGTSKKTEERGFAWLRRPST